MPLFELQCQDCKHNWETLLKTRDDLADESCPTCSGTQLQIVMSGFGGYHIKGDNSASQRPKRAGSFKK